MLSFFDLPTVLAIAEHAYTTGGEDQAALVWQLAGAPVLSAYPADPDKPAAQVYDHQWFSRRWPQLEMSDITAHPLIHPHYTSEHFPMTDTDQLLATLRDGLAAGWKLLAIDVGETDVTWYLARTRRKRDPKRQLGQRGRRPQHPLLQALHAAGFVTRNFPPGSDHWSASKWGPRYHLSIYVSPDTVALRCLPATRHDTTSTWSTILRADIPGDIAAAAVIAIAHIGVDGQHTTPTTP